MSDEGTDEGEEEKSTVTPIWRGIESLLEKAHRAAEPPPAPTITVADFLELQARLEETALRITADPRTGAPNLARAEVVADYLRRRMGFLPKG